MSAPGLRLPQGNNRVDLARPPGGQIARKKGHEEQEEGCRGEDQGIGGAYARQQTLDEAGYGKRGVDFQNLCL